MNLPEVTVIDENGEPINLKLWSETNDPEEQQEIFEAWEELYRRKEEIKNLKKTIKLTKKKKSKQVKSESIEQPPLLKNGKKSKELNHGNRKSNQRRYIRRNNTNTRRSCVGCIFMPSGS